MAKARLTDSYQEELEAAAEGKPATPKKEGRRVAVGTYVPEDLMLDVKELAVRLTRERGERVTIADLVTEALADLTAKHRKG